jgi:hypothetical protein
MPHHTLTYSSCLTCRWVPCSPAPSPDTYQHWGQINNTDGSSVPEPNQLAGAENCGVGNSSQAYREAWGWSDTDCMMPAASICKNMRKQRGRLDSRACVQHL